MTGIVAPTYGQSAIRSPNITEPFQGSAGDAQDLGGGGKAAIGRLITKLAGHDQRPQPQLRRGIQAANTNERPGRAIRGPADRIRLR
jgi:hypothetical protein